jgi:hypothetical protein
MAGLRLDYPWTVPDDARTLAQAQLPVGVWWPQVIEDLARFGWLHLNCEPEADGQRWLWMGGDGGVLAVSTGPDWKVSTLTFIEGRSARAAVEASGVLAPFAGQRL